MLHRTFRLQWISNEKGYGLFATEFIPRGTITFVNDLLDITIDSKDARFFSEPYTSVLEKYAYTNPAGQKVLCWDFGKYMNHCCQSNSITTGYGFDIALENIAAGEEITTDYGVFTLHHEMHMTCEKKSCRRFLNISSFDACVSEWDERIKRALEDMAQVPQPLWSLLEDTTLNELNSFKLNPLAYKSINTQKPQ